MCWCCCSEVVACREVRCNFRYIASLLSGMMRHAVAGVRCCARGSCCESAVRCLRGSSCMCHANLTFTDGCCLTSTTELVLPTRVYPWRPRFVLPMHKAKYRCWANTDKPSEWCTGQGGRAVQVAQWLDICRVRQKSTVCVSGCIGKHVRGCELCTYFCVVRSCSRTPFTVWLLPLMCKERTGTHGIDDVSVCFRM